MSSFIVYQKRPSATIRCFAFPFAGGNAAALRTFALEMPMNIEVYCYQPPGRQNRMREKFHENVDAYLNEVINDMKSLINVPYFLLGFSMGSQIAVRLAMSMRQLELPLPILIVISSSKSPVAEKRIGTMWHLLPDDGLIDVLRMYGNVPDAVLTNLSVRSMVVDPFRYDMKVLETFPAISDAPLDIPIISVNGARDNTVTSVEQYCEWQACTTKPLSMHSINAGHLFFLDASYRPEMINVIAQALHQ